MQETDFNFIDNRSQILEVLIRSKQESRSVGILSNKLGPSVLITGVEDVVFEDVKTVIVLKPFDHTGYILPSYKLEIQDIISVCPLNSEFRNPFIDNIGKEKNWFF
jgi:hypothetical protein